MANLDKRYKDTLKRALENAVTDIEKAAITDKLIGLGENLTPIVVTPKSSINTDAMNSRVLDILERSAALPRRKDVYPDIYETKELNRRIADIKPLITRDLGEPGRYDATVRESLKQPLMIPVLKKDTPAEANKKLAMKTYLDVANNQAALNIDDNAFADALAMSDAYKNAQPMVNIVEDVITPKKETTPSKLTAENLGNIYKYILLPAMGIAETVSSKGRRGGETALAAMQAFDVGYANRKAKEVADIKFQEEKKKIARHDALLKQLKELESYKVGDISTIADKDVADAPTGLEGILSNIPEDATEEEARAILEQNMKRSDAYLTPQMPSKSVSDSRKRASMAKMLGIPVDKLIGSESERTTKAQGAIEQFVRETDPLKYYELISKKQTLPKGASMKDKLLSEYDNATPERQKEIVSLLKLANNPFKASEALGELPSDYDTYTEEQKLSYISDRLAKSGNLSGSATVITKGLGVKTDKRDTEIKLAKDFSKVSEDYRDVKKNYNLMQNAHDSYVRTPDDKKVAGIVDQTLITLFNKILDPTSVVRESEYDRTPQGMALMDLLSGYYEKLAKGGPGITPEYRAEMVGQAKLALEAYQQSVKLMANKYKSDADAYGLDIERIIPSDVLSDIGYTKKEVSKNTSTTIPIIKTQEEFDALPSGADFYDINGVLKEKE